MMLYRIEATKVVYQYVVACSEESAIKRAVDAPCDWLIDERERVDEEHVIEVEAVY